MTLPIYKPLPPEIHHELDAMPLDELVSLLHRLGATLNSQWWDMLEDCEWRYQVQDDSGTVVRYV